MSKIYDALTKLADNLRTNTTDYHCDKFDSKQAAQNEIALQKQAEQEIIKLLPVKMVDTKIALSFNKYYTGYNDCVNEMWEMLEIETPEPEEGKVK